MTILTRELRRSLENTVTAARRAAETGAHKVIEQLAVHHHEPWPSMTPAQRELRNRLRAHGRQLGDRRDERRGVQAIDHLTTECAYEHWHRMLFARFLAEAELLIDPESGVAISLVECQEIARAGGQDWLELAAKYAQLMLPQIFRTGDPVLEVALPPETRSALEDLMKGLPGEILLADDSLGWVYQYWQADRKEAINHSEKKIGAEELPAVTQLFTEDYMVLFLLHNTLGAWWAGKVLAANQPLAATARNEDELRAACALDGVEWTYLRFVREKDQPWRPAAGTFEGWPEAAKDITLLDPCMGSGHFLVFALPILAALRARAEGTAREVSTLAVLRDNLFGLEIDPRCTQIAAFNLALAAWRRIGYQALPALHLACSGLSLGVNKADWLRLAERAAAELPVPPKTDLLGTEDNLFSDSMKRGFERLYDLFARAPWLGSLIDPSGAEGDLVEHGFAELEPTLAKVMTKTGNAELSEMAVAAQGISKAAEILSREFTLVATNVPYLGRAKQDDNLKDYCEARHPDAKADLATCFVERCLVFCAPNGSTALVTPQNWLFLGTYKKLRRRLLTERCWNTVVLLGSNAFQDMNWWAATTALTCITARVPRNSVMGGFETSGLKDPSDKAAYLSGAIPDEHVRLISAAHDGFSAMQVAGPLLIQQVDQQKNPDARIVISAHVDEVLLDRHADAFHGLTTGDTERLQRCFWEFTRNENVGWSFFCGPSDVTVLYGGRSHMLLWNEGKGPIDELPGSRKDGQAAWGRSGVLIRQMRHLPATLYQGGPFDINTAVIVPKDPENVIPLWCFVSSVDYLRSIRKIDQKVNVTSATLVKVGFDVAHWRKIAAETYPDGLPRPQSGDPTQWLFSGWPSGCDELLQVAVARLVGYRWPRQTGASFPDCPALGFDGLEKHADHDGIVTLSPVKGEQSAAGRLTALLSDSLGAEWSAAKLNVLLAQMGYNGRTLADWLRDGFFEEHCKLFHQRPFVWHVWDGRPDGFHALVNYHRLAAPNGEGRRTLEKLLYSYLGDWIDRQRSDQKAGVEGADARVAAAEQLRIELANILAGEPPYDLFLRWKPLVDQPIGWEPDINDGVRMNIRPFLAAKPLGARGKGACILRATPKIKWEKDRGKEPPRPREDFPWLWGWDERAENFEGAKAFDGNRWNDPHYSRSFKQAARARSKK